MNWMLCGWMGLLLHLLLQTSVELRERKASAVVVSGDALDPDVQRFVPWLDTDNIEQSTFKNPQWSFCLGVMPLCILTCVKNCPVLQ